MEVHFTPEQEAQLSQIADHTGTLAAHLVKDAALRLLEEDGRFRAAVRKGIEQAHRSEFIEEEEMDVHIERMLQSWCASVGLRLSQRIWKTSTTTARSNTRIGRGLRLLKSYGCPFSETVSQPGA